MKRMIGVLAVAVTTTAGAHDEDALAETRASLEDARARLAEAAREMAEATREQFAARSDRAMIGVLIADQDEQGVLVGGVTPDGGAEAAGVLADDLITGINGEPLTGLDRPVRRLREVLDDVTAGDPVNVVILRDGELSDVEVVTTKAYRGDLVPHFDFDWLPRVDVPARVMAFRDRFERRGNDLKLVDIGEDLGDYFGVDAGVLVLDTPANSDLRPGDIVKRIDDADVGSSSEAYRLLAGDGEAAVEVRRKNRSVDVTVAKHSRRPGVFVFRAGDGDEEHEDEVEVEVDVGEAH
ncbi:MAG: PDZ domain-containing protein [Gammaproteobacteria bacterium]|nr:PDZ domain-containing protein [Gammaproteobacteria bacterium]